MEKTLEIGQRTTWKELMRVLVIIPLASIRNYKKVIKINLTIVLNFEILHSLIHGTPVS
jgi:hypothetical protein